MFQCSLQITISNILPIPLCQIFFALHLFFNTCKPWEKLKPKNTFLLTIIFKYVHMLTIDSTINVPNFWLAGPLPLFLELGFLKLIPKMTNTLLSFSHSPVVHSLFFQSLAQDLSYSSLQCPHCWVVFLVLWLENHLMEAVTIEWGLDIYSFDCESLGDVLLRCKRLRSTGWLLYLYYICWFLSLTSAGAHIQNDLHILAHYSSLTLWPDVLIKGATYWNKVVFILGCTCNMKILVGWLTCIDL